MQGNTSTPALSKWVRLHHLHRKSLVLCCLYTQILLFLEEKKKPNAQLFIRSFKWSTARITTWAAMDQPYWKEDLREEEVKNKMRTLLPQPPTLLLLDNNGSMPVSFVFWCLHQPDKNTEVKKYFRCIFTFWEIILMHYLGNNDMPSGHNSLYLKLKAKKKRLKYSNRHILCLSASHSS